jgi:hypothetical protein
MFFSDTLKRYKIVGACTLLAGACLYSAHTGPSRTVTMQQAVAQQEVYTHTPFVRSVRYISAIDSSKKGDDGPFLVRFQDGPGEYVATIPPSLQPRLSGVEPGMYISLRGSLDGQMLAVTDLHVHRWRRVKIVTSIIGLALALLYVVWGYLRFRLEVSDTRMDALQPRMIHTTRKGG